MRKDYLIGILVIVLFLFPMINTSSDYSPAATVSNLYTPLITDTGQYALSSDHSSGVGSALPVSIGGQVANIGQGTLSFDSSSPGISSITIEDGWTGSDIQAQIESLSWAVEDVLENGDLDDYHNELFVVTPVTTDNDDNVQTPDGWTIVKDVVDYDSLHPQHGMYELDSDPNGNGGTRGVYVVVEGTSSYNYNPNDEMYISQMVSIPYREVQSATVTFDYRVRSTSYMDDMYHLFVRLAGYTSKFHVFESGDATDTWLSASVNIPATSMTGLSNKVIRFDIGLATDYSGVLGVDSDNFAYIDNVEVDLVVRPFPEQIDLKANGTLVWGSSSYSVYPYVPDDDNRDCYDDSGHGMDVTGYDGGPTGELDTGIYSSGYLPGGLFETGLQFPLDIPQGAIITSAYLEVEAYDSSSPHVYGMRVHVGDLDNVTSFPTWENGTHLEDWIGDWVETSVAWEINSWLTSVDTRYRSPEIGPLVQNVISRPGWSEGNYICLMTSMMYVDYYQRWSGIKGSTGFDGEDLARLFVEYIIPEPEDTVLLFDYQKDITVDHNDVVSDLTDFPVLIDIIDSDLKEHVLSNGNDIIFTVGGNPVAHEIELYNHDYSPTEAHLVAWVNVPSLSSSVDTVITMHYGCVNAPPNIGIDVWSDYETVHHLNQDPTGINYDSTDNNHDGTSYGGLGSSDLVSGQIGNAVDFDGSNDVISIGQIDTDEWTQFTMSAWIYRSESKDARVFSKSSTTDPSYHIITLRLDSNDHVTTRIRTDVSGNSYSSTATASNFTWHYISWSWDASRTGHEILAYLDGVLVIDRSHAGTSVYDSDEMFVLGNNDLVNPRWFAGIIDEARLTTFVRDEAWVDTEYNNQANPSGFYTVGSETKTVDTWTDASEPGIYFTTSSPNTVAMDVYMVMDVGGEAQTMDENFDNGVSYYIESGATIVNWTAKVMVSPPAGATSFGFTVEYPRGEWKPTTVLNPINKRKTLDQDWWYQAGTLTLNRTSIDFWGVWTLKFISWNVIDDVQQNSGVFNINDISQFTVTSPTIQGARVGLDLIDPDGTTWYSSYQQTVTDPSHRFPSFRYRKDLTIASSVIYGDVTDFPVLVQFSDDTDLNDVNKVRADGSDILFADGDVVLDHEIEMFNQEYTFTEAKLTAWVKMNLTTGSDKTISMYYGSPVVDRLENPVGVWSSNFDAVWHLGEDVVNEGSGAIHADSSGNGYDGVQNGNAEYISGRAGYAQDFDGINDFISITDQLTPEGDVLITGWFRIASSHTSTSANTQVIMEKYIDIDHDMIIALVGQDYGQGTVPNGSLVFKVESSPNSAMYKWTQKTSWTPGWYFIGCYADEDNPAGNQIFVGDATPDWDTDAGQVGSTTWANMSYTEEWQLGGGDWDSGSTGSGWFDGQLDEFRVASVVRSTGWLQTEVRNQVSPHTFAVRGSEIARASPDHVLSKTIDSTAPAGEWTAIVHYNDTGTSVTDTAGLFETTFIVKHDTTLAKNSPTATMKTVGDALIIEYELTDDITASGVAGATVTMNWTSPSTITLDDYGGGRYGKVLDTEDLGDAQQYRVDIQSYHQYYNNDTAFFNLDLYHNTILDASGVTTTPAGYDFTTTLTFTDTYTGAPITDATITFSDGNPVSHVNNGDGTYDVSVATGALGLGNHPYSFNATSAGGYLHVGNVDVTFTLRAHYTAVSVSGDFETPYGQDTTLTVYLLDLDTGLPVDILDVDTFNYSWSGGEQLFSSIFTYTMDLDTDAWSVSPPVTVTLTITMSDPNILAPAQYTFDVTIIAHKTSLTVTGVTTKPYGNQTDLSIILTDLETGGIVPIGAVMDIDLQHNFGTNNFFGTYDYTLDTSGWTVGTWTVTVVVTMGTAIYATPSNYQFDITIRSMDTVLYHGPSALNFTRYSDFTIDLQLNVTEAGPYFGDPITGRLAGEFSVPGYAISIIEQGSGTYTLTISESYFVGGLYEITVYFTSADTKYADAFLVIKFWYREITSYLTSPNYPQVTTPYGLDVQITLEYADADFGTGIIDADIDSPTNDTLLYNINEVGGGVYTVWIDVAGLDKATYSIFLRADKAGYDARTIEIRIVIRDAFTSATPSVGSLDIPLGNSMVFYVDYIDIDRLLVIDNLTGTTNVVSDWSGTFSVEYVVVQQEYMITFHTTDTSPMVLNQLYNFTFSRPNYQSAIFSISISIRTHNTEFRLVSSIEPTSTIGTFNISVYYGDLDNGVGISSPFVSFRVSNGTDVTISDVIDNTGGFYTIQVPASQFVLGLQTLTVYADWTDVIPKYQDKSFVTTANVVGRESALTLLIGSEPTPYDESMSFLFFYSDLYSATGINNDTFNVFIYVTFQGESVDLGQVIITEVDSSNQPGNYSIQFDTGIFSRTGLIYMNVFVNWSKGVAPFYANRTDVVSVRVLPRDTLLSVTPPSPTSFGEQGSFTFTFEDVTGSYFIGDDPSLSISSNITFGYSEVAGEFTITFDTTQFVAVGVHAIQLSVEWDGVPFYTNRTGRIVYINIINRVTFLEYLAPAPTPYLDEVVFNVTWTDITEGATDPITGATVTLYNGLTPIDGAKYSVFEYVALGIYRITLNTTFVANPGSVQLRVGVSVGATGVQDAFTTRTFTVRERLALLASEPISTVPYNSSVIVILYYQDLFTTGIIGNESADGYPVTLEILDGPGSGPWYFTVTWRSAFGDYFLEVDTYNLGLSTGVPYTLELRISYAYQSPYYSSDDLVVQFQVRDRESTLSLTTEPDTTPFGDNTTFTVFFGDDDASDAGIVGATITIPALTQYTDYVVTPGSPGYYTINLDTDALATLGPHPLDVHADWFGEPYHTNVTRSVNVLVRERDTNVDVTVPPPLTKYLDDVTFSFVYTDLDAGVPITAITVANVHLYFDDYSPIVGFSINQIGSIFEVTVNSTDLSATPVSGLVIRVEVDWNIADQPFYADDETTVKVNIVGRTMQVEPEQIERTPKDDTLTITINLIDADNLNPVQGAIIQFSCQNDTLLLGDGYTISESLGVYTIEVDTTFLTGTGNFLFDVEAQWNPLLSPYYTNRSVITLTGFVDLIWTSFQASSPVPSSVQITGNVYILVTYVDIDHGQAGITGATIDVRYTHDMSEPTDLSVTPLSDGVYNVSFSTVGLSLIGSYSLQITASRGFWTTGVVTPSFSVTLISTSLSAVTTVVQVGWSELAHIRVDYHEFLNDGPVAGATVMWSVGTESDSMQYDAPSGEYYANIDTSKITSTTWIVTVNASLNLHQFAVATITLVILSLPSDMIVLEPIGVPIVDRGSPVYIQIQLNDTFRGILLSQPDVTRVYVLFRGFEYDMNWVGISQTWEINLPGSATTLDPGPYDIRVIADMINHNPATDQIKIIIGQTGTELSVRDYNTGELIDDIDTVFTAIVRFSVNFTEIDNGTLINEATIWWYSADFNGLNLTFTYNISTQLWDLEFNTTFGFYGTWGLTIRASPTDPVLAPATATLTLTIAKITTEVYGPTVTTEVDWGWVGNISFTYYDTFFDVGISNATILYDYGPFTGLEAFDLGNGTYMLLINTTYLTSNAQHRIIVDLRKDNYVERTSGANIYVELRSTELTVSVDDTRTYEESEDVSDLQIPMGEILNITFFYNDTSPIGGLYGGIEDADVEAALISLDYLGGTSHIQVISLGSGWYSFLFDTNNLSLYATNENQKIIIPGSAFILRVEMGSLNRFGQEITVEIEIVERPTDIQYTGNTVFNLLHGDTLDVTLTFYDLWSSEVIEGAYILYSGGTSARVEDGSNRTLSDGQYQVTIRVFGTAGDNIITIRMESEFYTSQELIITVSAAPNDTDLLIRDVTTYGLPISIFIILLLGAYVKIWSVPKRIRQINGQLKALRKGKVPKPIGDVKSRQQLVAELFNDTFEEMKITRIAAQMPEEAIPIEVPEMGELLMQLAILTNLNAEELDEFQADIAKMKMSEQAAFVKEVIMQEAIRAARRDGRTVEETVAAVEQEALRRLGGEEEVEPIDVVDTGPIETVFLEEEKKVEVIREDKVTPEDKEVFEEVTETTSEKMSLFEIEELRKDLERKGVPPHEIETIIEQAKELPRELIDELVRSLEGRKD